MRWEVLLLACVVAAAGCSSTKTPVLVLPEIPGEFPNHTRAEILTNVAESSDGYHSFKSKTRVRLQTTEEDESANLNIQYRRGDTLFASLRVTFGIEGAKTLITTDSFFVYRPIGNKLYYGEAAMVAAFFPTPAPLDELFPNLTGTVVPKVSERWQISADSVYYYLVDDDHRTTYAVDPRLWRVVRLEKRSAAGTIEEIRTYSDFDQFGYYIVPRRIEATRPVERRKISVYHRDVEINPEELSLDFRIGDVDERILVSRRSP